MTRPSLYCFWTSDNAVQDRHCSGNFSDPNRLFRSLQHTWGSVQQNKQQHRVVFKSICLDYFFSPQGWAGDRWTSKFFTGTLPQFCEKEWLEVDGTVWLPNIQHVSEVYITTFRCFYIIMNENKIITCHDLIFSYMHTFVDGAALSSTTLSILYNWIH